MFKLLISMMTGIGVATAFPCGAQAVELGQRPIKRTEVLAGVKAQFATMDRNHDGAIDDEEFEAYRARQAKLPDGGAGLYHIGSRWFEKSDADGDGRVTLAEAGTRPLQMFDLADANRDGIASVAEQKLAMMLKGLGG
ncbi:EF-hand domain-containing protein [Novosphingobium sp. BL-52-GroH]|uniref:EF-hand domain-containing protein n=1 Tax=Novosphingobium sp. BL-52-GroH TaxID=3349877 RepID=UPI00384F5A96